MDDSVSSLSAISPIDGRYHDDTEKLSQFFSEYALIRTRVEVEVRYLDFFITNVLKEKLSVSSQKKLDSIFLQFNDSDAKRVKEIERETKHDVKAVEYFIREKLHAQKLEYSAYIHFGLTSEDTNSLAQGLLLQRASHEVIIPTLESLIDRLSTLAKQYRSVPMLARTHGQPAIPTTVGKEVMNFAIRIAKELHTMRSLQIEAKLSGAVGNFSAVQLAFPKLNWLRLSKTFIESLGLKPNNWTTQIVPADSYVQFFQSLELVNTIVIGLDQDMWRYISDEYFVQVVKPNEVGSSTMPQKVNPIHFENSEGNLGIANALIHHFIAKLPISRLQRDLSDSTVKRNFGVAVAHSVLGYQSCINGFARVTPNTSRLHTELLGHWEVITEALQTIVRKTGDAAAYERLKTFARGKTMDQKNIIGFVHSLPVSQTVKKQLLGINPLNYLGLAEQLVDDGAKEVAHLLSKS